MLRDLCSRGRLWVKVMLFLKFALWGGLTIASPMLTITPSQPLNKSCMSENSSSSTFAISGFGNTDPDDVPNPAEASLGIVGESFIVSQVHQTRITTVGDARGVDTCNSVDQTRW